jgi:hypothetical protein
MVTLWATVEGWGRALGWALEADEELQVSDLEWPVCTTTVGAINVDQM